MIEHRKYLLSYSKDAWTFGYFKNILENPPCKKPGSPKNKQYEYELERIKGVKYELYLHLVGEIPVLDQVEKELAKYKIARFINESSLVIIIDQLMSMQVSCQDIEEYCREKGFALLGRQIMK